MGSGDDVQPQYPVEISAEAFIKEEQSLVWKRGLNSELGNMTVKDAKDLTAISEEYQRRLREGDASLCLPLIAYYGTGRLWDYHREKRMDIFKQSTRTNGYIDCLDGTANLKLMMNWFQKMTVKKYQKLEDTGESVPELDAVCQAMEKCYSAVTGYENVKIRCNMDTNDLDVSYTEENGMRMRIPLSQMSDGYKSTLSLIADIAYRMANLNPQLLDNILIETTGVVLIDEVDLHLHPTWQQRVLEDLTTIFPEIQFIVTTHAPEVINSAHSENLIILKDSQIQYTEYQIYGKDVKSVLHEVMGVNERPKKVAVLGL